MDKFDFTQYTAKRYGIDESTAETMIDMFSSCLQELVAAGKSVEIDGIGEFQTTPLFPNGLNHNRNIALAKLSKKNIVSFIPNKNLLEPA